MRQFKDQNQVVIGAGGNELVIGRDDDIVDNGRVELVEAIVAVYNWKGNYINCILHFWSLQIGLQKSIFYFSETKKRQNTL